jgi:hypothetical protein
MNNPGIMYLSGNAKSLSAGADHDEMMAILIY